jgi:hypothetical protein
VVLEGVRKLRGKIEVVAVSSQLAADQALDLGHALLSMSILGARHLPRPTGRLVIGVGC